jgi:hypothetical protein
MRERFIEWAPRAETAELVEQINTISEDYWGRGYRMTLRQLYYQLVARVIIPNTDRSYKRLGSIVDSARLGGLLNWDYIEDRTRNVYGTDGADTSPEAAIRSTAGGYARRLWETQPEHVELWVEKEALTGVVARAAREMGVNYFACRGYVSQSEMYSSAKRFASYGKYDGKRTTILHLGDHDPSGIDMTRDIRDRLTLFAGEYAPTVTRIALNMDQVERYALPPNPAKITDARFVGYQERFGDESWELDAIDVTALHDLMVDRVRLHRNEVLWREAVERQESERQQLTDLSDNWSDVVSYLGEIA